MHTIMFAESYAPPSRGLPLHPVMIGKRAVGSGHPAYVVAEIGINHNGDLDLARQMIDAAHDAGADAVKFQNYRTEDFISDRSLTYTYQSQGSSVTEPQYDMFKRYELSDRQVLELADYSRSTGIDFHSTPTGPEGIAILRKAGVGVLKNGSDFLGHLPLITAMGETGLPTVLSTGMASTSAIEDAVDAFRATGNDQLITQNSLGVFLTPPI